MTTDKNNGKKGAYLKQSAWVCFSQNLNILLCHTITEVQQYLGLPLLIITNYFFHLNTS
jgi:hypothetical protein